MAGSALVVGAGVTGLAAAVALRKAGTHVTVREASGRAGGPVRTVRRDGFVLEQGPESIRGGAPPVGRLLDDLRLGARVVKASAASSARLLLHRGELVALGPKTLPRLLRKRDLARLLAEPLIPRGGVSDETVQAFVRRRLGAAATDLLLDPVIAGIYGGDPTRIEASSGLSKLWRLEQEHGSLLRGAMRAPKGTEPKGSFTFLTGMEELVDALVATVGADLALGDPVVSLERDGSGWRARTAGGERWSGDRVVVTAPPAALAQLFPALRVPELPTARVAAVHLAFPESAAKAAGFGWLAHHRERADVLGCLWVSSTFPTHAPPGTHLFRLMMGGAREPGAADLSDEALVARARRVLAEVQGVRAEPILADVARPPGIPQYPPGWSRFLIEARKTGLSFAGWSWGGIGVADGIAAGYATVSAA